MRPAAIDLNAAFDYYNEVVWGGSLPKVQCSYADLREHNAVGAFWPDTWKIEVDYSQKHSDVYRTLLHEMVHLCQAVEKTPLNHGREFRKWKSHCRRVTGLDI